MKWFFLILTMPILEIIVFFKINEMIGTFYTIFSIITTALIGAVLVQKQGKSLILNLKKQGTNPFILLSYGLFLIIAGVLLLTPGFITDIVGFLILTPSIRRNAINYLSKRYIPH